MSEYFRKYIKRDVPPAANIKFRCAKLHRHTEGDQVILQHNTIYDVLKSRGWKEADMEQAPNDWSFFLGRSGLAPPESRCLSIFASTSSGTCPPQRTSSFGVPNCTGTPRGTRSSCSTTPSMMY
mmetsp:Transcript_88642/g.237017  ORF Transcript_88642/g.237017 Transcript_88642/m.237017 type:complete len:124 (-) Transcript_88642:12-383(-)